MRAHDYRNYVKQVVHEVFYASQVAGKDSVHTGSVSIWLPEKLAFPEEQITLEQLRELFQHREALYCYPSYSITVAPARVQATGRPASGAYRHVSEVFGTELQAWAFLQAVVQARADVIGVQLARARARLDLIRSKRLDIMASKEVTA